VAKSGKAREVTVEGEQFATPFYRKRRVPSIGGSSSEGVRFNAQPSEDIPVTLARLDQPAMGLLQQIVTETECIL
jgi:hypothetical protein